MPTTATELEARTVLLVDDEAQSRKWFARTFGNEFAVVVASGVEEALAVLRQQAPGPDEIAVLVTDYRMPQRNGLDLLRSVQREFRHLVPLLATAYADKEVAIAAVNEGRVFRILEKPLDEDATRQALREALALYRTQAHERALHENRALAMREILGFLAHELNTPLATVRGNMGALRDRYQALASGQGTAVFTEHRPGELIAAIDSAERRALYCQSLVSSFVQSAREAHPGAVVQTVSAIRIVRTLLDEFPFDADERNWVAHRVHEDFVLPGRRDLLYLVLCTLTKNALQALRGRASPTLVIEQGTSLLDRPPARPWMRFIDNGPGIAPDILARLTLEPVTTRAASGGHGMGLVFCRRVMQSIGGAIDVQSERGQGTTVTLHFPLS